MKRTFRIFLKFSLWTLLVLAAGVAMLWWRFRPDAQGRVVPLFEKIDMAALPRLTDSIPQATASVLCEGLPHQGWEITLFESEREAKPHIESHGHLFYAEAITPTPAQLAQLVTIIRDSATFEEWGGMKMCGLYHPDWLMSGSCQTGPGISCTSALAAMR